MFIDEDVPLLLQMRSTFAPALPLRQICSQVVVYLAAVAAMFGMSVDASMRLAVPAEHLAPFVAILGSAAADAASAAVGDVVEAAVAAAAVAVAVAVAAAAEIAAAAFESAVAEGSAFEMG